MPVHSEKSRLLSGAAYSLFGSLLLQGSQLVASIIAVRTIGVHDFATFAAVQTTVAAATVLSSLGLITSCQTIVASTLSGQPHEIPPLLRAIAITAFVCTSIASLGVLYTRHWVASTVFVMPDVESALALGSLLLFVTTLQAITQSILGGFEDFRAIAVISLVRSVVLIGASASLTTAFGIKGAFATLISSSGVGFVLGAVRLLSIYRKSRVPEERPAKSQLPALVRSMIPLALNGIFLAPITWITSGMLSQSPDGSRQLTYFSTTTTWRSLLIFVPNTMATALLPMLARMIGAKGGRNAASVTNYTLAITGAVCVPLALIGILATDAIWTLYSINPNGAGLSMQIATLTGLLLAIQVPIGNLLVADSRLWLSLCFNALWACIVLSLAWYTTNAGYGAEGLAVSQLIAYVVNLICLTGYLRIRNRQT